jgi:hypothetical protein
MGNGKYQSFPFPLSHFPFLAGFVVLAGVHTWPLAAHLSTRIPHDPGDPVLNTWIIWWNAQAVPLTERWWSAPIFFPLPDALALSEHLAGLSPLTTPIVLAGGRPLAAYNVALIASFALSAFFAYLLVLRLTSSRLAAICAGLAYGFSPYRAGQLAHLQVLTSQWMPLTLLALHGCASRGQVLNCHFFQGLAPGSELEKSGNSRSDPRIAWLAVFGGAWLLQAMSNGYYLLFLPVLIVLWLAWFVDWRRSPRTGVAIAAAWLVASLPLIPVLLRYRDIHESLALSRRLDEIRHFSATLSSFVQASPMLRFWSPGSPKGDEDYLFPGVTVVVVIAAGVVAAIVRRRGDRAFIFYAAAACLMWMLAFGPAAPDDGVRAVLRPYTLLWHLPGFEGLRVPARFAMLATLCASVACGLAIAALAPRRPGPRAAVGALIVAGLVADGWMRPMPLFPHPSRFPLPDAPNTAVVELPTDDPFVSVSAMYRSMDHRRPLVSGYSGHVPPHYSILSTALRREDASPLRELARGRSLVIVVDDRRDSGGDFRRLVRGLPGVEQHQVTGAGEVYLLPPTPQERAAARGVFWSARIEELARGRRIDLGAVRTIRTIEFSMRDRYVSLHTRMAFEASIDGANWSTVWEDWTGGPAVAAALRDAREAPVRITLPDVAARYLRFGPAPEWLWREIRVYGP